MDTNGSPLDAVEAQQVLDQLQHDRARASDRVRTPLWHRIAFALTVVTAISAFALPEDAFTVAFSASAIVAVLLGLVRPWVTKTQADPWSDGTALKIGLAQTVAVLGTGAAGVLLYTATGLAWVLWVAAVLAGTMSVVLETRMESVFASSIHGGRR